MNSIADTDILSAFAKAEGTIYLLGIFDSVFIAPSVFAELSVASRKGFAFADEIISSVKQLVLTEMELQEVSALRNDYPALGNGEIESIVVAKQRSWILLTNDSKAKSVCERTGVTFLDLEELLRVLKRKHILSNMQLKEFIQKIEQRDRTVIKAREEILKNTDL